VVATLPFELKPEELLDLAKKFNARRLNRLHSVPLASTKEI